MPVTLRHENGPFKTERFSFDEWGMTKSNEFPGFPGRFRVSEEHMEYFSKYPNAFIEQEKKFNKFAQKNYKR